MPPAAASWRYMDRMGSPDVTIPQDEELTQKTIDTIRTFVEGADQDSGHQPRPSRSQRRHGSRPEAGRGSVLGQWKIWRREMMPAGSPADDDLRFLLALPMVTYKYDPGSKGRPARLPSLHEWRNCVILFSMMPLPSGR